MTNKEFITLILSRCGRREGNDKLRTTVEQEIQILISQMEKTKEELPWFLETTDSRVMIVNQPWIELPSNFLKEVEESVLLYKDPDDNQWYGGVKRIPDVTRGKVVANAASLPETYSIYGNRLIFGPAPMKAYAYELPYARTSDLFTENEEQITDWCLHATQAVSNTIQEIICRQHLQDDQMAARYTQMAMSAWIQFKDYCNTRKYTNLTVSSGDN